MNSNAAVESILGSGVFINVVGVYDFFHLVTAWCTHIEAVYS